MNQHIMDMWLWDFPNGMVLVSNTRDQVLTHFQNRRNTSNCNTKRSVFGEVRGDCR